MTVLINSFNTRDIEAAVRVFSPRVTESEFSYGEFRELEEAGFPRDHFR